MPDQIVGSLGTWLSLHSILEDWDTYADAYQQDYSACKRMLQTCRDPALRTRLRDILQLMKDLHSQAQREGDRAA